MKIDVKDINYMVNECVSRILKEGWRPSYRTTSDGYVDYDGDFWDGEDDDEESPEDIERKRIIDNCEYDAYVLVDESDGAILATYTIDNGDEDGEIFDEAYEDAKAKKQSNKFGSYSIYGCIGTEYDDDTLMYNTN